MKSQWFIRAICSPKAKITGQDDIGDLGYFVRKLQTNIQKKNSFMCATKKETTIIQHFLHGFVRLCTLLAKSNDIYWWAVVFSTPHLRGTPQRQFCYWKIGNVGTECGNKNRSD